MALSSSVVRLICPSTPPQFGQRQRRRVAKVYCWPYRAMIDDFEDHHKRLWWWITRPLWSGPIALSPQRQTNTIACITSLRFYTYPHTLTDWTNEGWLSFGSWAHLAITERKVWTVDTTHNGSSYIDNGPSHNISPTLNVQQLTIWHYNNAWSA